jgi:hypothetical protein
VTTLNLTGVLERLVADMVSRMEELRHIDPQRVMICVSSTRSGGVHGTYAKIHPLRFSGGLQSSEVSRGRRRFRLTMPQLTRRGVDMLYVIYFLVPRFLDLSLREKLITVCHELYHISPEFDGDIRRFSGRNYAHGSSTRRYNELMGELVDRYLATAPPTELLDMLAYDNSTLRQRFPTLVGRRVAAPRIRVESIG